MHSFLNIFYIKDDCRVLGVDLGSKKIGFAIYYKNLNSYIPLQIAKIQHNNLIDIVQKIINDYQIDCIVFGIPLQPDGSLTANGMKIKQQIDTITEQIQIPFCMEDESFSTRFAYSHLRDIGVRHSRVDNIDDSMAAQITLQNLINKIQS